MAGLRISKLFSAVLETCNIPKHVDGPIKNAAVQVILIALDLSSLHRLQFEVDK